MDEFFASALPDFLLNRDRCYLVLLLLHRVTRRVLEMLGFGSSLRYRVSKRKKRYTGVHAATVAVFK